MSAILEDLQPSSLALEELARRWAQLVNDPVLRNLPYRIELNKWGHIEMTPPASPMHMDIATTLALMLRERLGAKTLAECAITTAGGVKVADEAWCSTAYVELHRDAFSNWEATLPRAPELCIEVMSPSNLAAELKEKIALYIEAGAQEGWIVYPDRRIGIFDADGMRSSSRFPVDIAELEAALRAL
jgi:Uma2 family endonuclease